MGLAQPVLPPLQLHEDLMSFPVDLVPYRATARCVWELRDAVWSYDACYVALAEQVEVDLVTLDARLMRAPGPRCRFRSLPPLAP